MRRCCKALLLVSGLVAGAYAVPDSGTAADTLQKAVPAAPQAKLAAAMAAPCSSAVSVFQELSADSTAPDSVRRGASGRRADIAFALREYETACDYYKKAATFEKGLGRYHFRTAVAALANGDTAEALKMFSTVIDSGETPFRHEAALQKGELLLGKKEYQAAMDLFQKTGPFSFKNSWSVRALLGKLECARRLGLADSAVAWDRRLSGYRQTILEKERLRKVREIPLAKPQSGAADSTRPAAPAVKDTATADSVFALQVGAFGSKANAEALAKKLKQKHKEVLCVPAVVEERTFYRVWVGNFDTREAAERFGRDKLMREGFVYRVVVK
jgi:tetratricopeptide (TPR) repeat protein